MEESESPTSDSPKGLLILSYDTLPQLNAIYWLFFYTSDTKEGGIEPRTLSARVNVFNHFSYKSLFFPYVFLISFPLEKANLKQVLGSKFLWLYPKQYHFINILLL